MSTQGALFVRRGSSAADFAAALAWLWRLGPVRSEPHTAAVGIGGLEEAAEMRELVDRSRLRGAVIFADEPGEAVGPVPHRELRRGVAAFPGGRVRGEFVIFGREDGLVRSSLGAHAFRDRSLLIIGAGIRSWGSLGLAWILDTVATFLAELLDRPLVRLPPVGCLRWDDVPGTAHEQLTRTAHSDRQQQARVARVLRACRRNGAKVNLAVPVSALHDGAQTEIDRVWPRTVATLVAGVRDGFFELVCHGTLHIDTAAWAGGRLDPREFAELDADDAGRRLETATQWLTSHVAAPHSFVAPAWGYSPGTLTAARDRGLPTWHPARPGPLLEGNAVWETLATGLPGLTGLDYRPLSQLAHLGLPPVLVIHGTLLDFRLANLRLPRDALVLARLALRRDLLRVLSTAGVRWISASELIARLRHHASIDAA